LPLSAGVALQWQLTADSHQTQTQGYGGVPQVTSRAGRTVRLRNFPRYAQPRLHPVLVSPELGEEVVLARFAAEFEGCMTVYYKAKPATAVSAAILSFRHYAVPLQFSGRTRVGNSTGYRRRPSSAARRREKELETHSRLQLGICACTRRRTQRAGLEVDDAPL
jgi:hypothetical protein